MLSSKLKLPTERALVSHSEFLTLVYHDLFGHPLTRAELSFWQIGREIFPKHQVERTGDFFHLPGKSAAVLGRLAKAAFTRKKLTLAQKAARLLSFLPTIKLVGVTGALAMQSAQKEDDIDLLVVTAKKTLWSTRLLSFLLLKFAGFPLRRPADRDFADKLCLNLWLDEENLGFRQRGDLYTAHEILQVKPILTRGGFTRLLRENAWVGDFFPKARPKNGFLEPSGVKSFILAIGNLPFVLLNLPAYRLQLTYMAKRRTREKVGLGFALFHPAPWHQMVNAAFAARLTNFFRVQKSDAVKAMPFSN